MSKRVKIKGRWVGDDEPVFIIADVGSNHDRKKNQAKKLIDIAADSGVDAVKFQLFKTEKLYPRNNHMFDVMKRNELPREWITELLEYAYKRGLIFLATPFDEESVDFLYKVDVPAYKWASSETTNLNLLRYAAARKRPMIISTGMCDLADIYEAVEVVFSSGNKDIILLHCTSLYPTKPSNVNLRMMDTLRDCFHLPVGYSDHTLGSAISVAAVARGACVIEKHFTISRNLKGPDHSFALEPGELKEMVKAIRQIEQSLGSPIKKMLPEEEKVARRNSIIAKTDIPKGSRITKDMVEIKRPAFGIKPRFLEVVVGRKTKKDIKKGDPITWKLID